MPSRELLYLMTMSQTVTPDTLDKVLRNASLSKKGDEISRIKAAPSWGTIFSSGLSALLSAGIEITTTKVSNLIQWKNDPITSFQALSADGQKQLMNAVANDPNFPDFIRSNKKLVTCCFQHLLAANPNKAKKKSRSIEKFVDVLPELVKSLQSKGCLKDVTNLNELGDVVVRQLLEDAKTAQAGPDATNLYKSSRDMVEKFLDMTADHPIAARNIMGRMAFSTQSPSHQLQMSGTLSRLKSEVTSTKVGPDKKGKKRPSKTML